MPAVMYDRFHASGLETSSFLSDKTLMWLTIPTSLASSADKRPANEPNTSNVTVKSVFWTHGILNTGLLSLGITNNGKRLL